MEDIFDISQLEFYFLGAFSCSVFGIFSPFDIHVYIHVIPLNHYGTVRNIHECCHLNNPASLSLYLLLGKHFLYSLLVLVPEQRAALRLHPVAVGPGERFMQLTREARAIKVPYSACLNKKHRCL